jgi:hypothetical protein
VIFTKREKWKMALDLVPSKFFDISKVYPDLKRLMDEDILDVPDVMNGVGVVWDLLSEMALTYNRFYLGVLPVCNGVFSTRQAMPEFQEPVPAGYPRYLSYRNVTDAEDAMANIHVHDDDSTPDDLRGHLLSGRFTELNLMDLAKLYHVDGAYDLVCRSNVMFSDPVFFSRKSGLTSMSPSALRTWLESGVPPVIKLREDVEDPILGPSGWESRVASELVFFGRADLNPVLTREMICHPSYDRTAAEVVVAARPAAYADIQPGEGWTVTGFVPHTFTSHKRFGFDYIPTRKFV